MNDNLNIDFDKIIAQVERDIAYANNETLENCSASQASLIKQTAKIASGVCISALRAYHEELCQQLSSLIQTKDE